MPENKSKLVTVNIGGMLFSSESPTALRDAVSEFVLQVGVKEMAALAGVHERTVHRWAERHGSFPGIPCRLCDYMAWLGKPRADDDAPPHSPIRDL